MPNRATASSVGDDGTDELTNPNVSALVAATSGDSDNSADPLATAKMRGWELFGIGSSGRPRRRPQKQPSSTDRPYTRSASAAGEAAKRPHAENAEMVELDRRALGGVITQLRDGLSAGADSREGVSGVARRGHRVARPGQGGGPAGLRLTYRSPS